MKTKKSSKGYKTGTSQKIKTPGNQSTNFKSGVKGQMSSDNVTVARQMKGGRGGKKK